LGLLVNNLRAFVLPDGRSTDGEDGGSPFCRAAAAAAAVAAAAAAAIVRACSSVRACVRACMRLLLSCDLNRYRICIMLL